MNELMSGNTPIGMPFTLTDQHGKKTRLADFRGKLVLLYFGYTTCPDVCPTTLLDVSQWMSVLGTDADRLRVVFVSVDPGRDTPTVMKEYLSNFDPHIRGFSGTPEQVADLMVDWFENGAADGFNVMPPLLPSQFEVFATQVVPILQKRGLFRTAYEGPTLRDILELPKPVSRYARPEMKRAANSA